MANSLEDNRGPAEQRGSLPNTLEEDIREAIAGKMTRAHVEGADAYDLAAFESTTATEFKASFPGYDTQIDEMTARVINTGADILMLYLALSAFSEND